LDKIQGTMKLLVLLAFTILLAAAPASAATCESLSGLTLPNTTIATAESVPAGPFTPPSTKTALRDLPAFCRVAGVIKPTADSNIQFEVWMPASGWNGKFQGIGNGGFAGSLSYGALAASLRRGYAGATTDTGHSGNDAAWAVGHREKLIDYGHRAIHEMTVTGKAVAAAFYGKPPQRSYFASCSNGGRQALMEAQRYPADYDGIISGAPANYFTHIAVGFVWDQQALLADPASFIPPSKMKAIEAGALAACDAKDGLTDNLIDDPRQCRFDPSTLLCPGAESDSCLTAPQVAALKKIYEGPKNSKGKSIFPGFVPGAETGSGGWTPWVTGADREKSLQFFFGTQLFRNMLFEDPAWNYKTLNYDKDVKLADEKLGPILNATDPNLKAFQSRGGKLILYHGWCDAALTPLNTIRYYEEVVKKAGKKKAADFVRLYMVPGVQHCAGGPGTDQFWGAAGTKSDPEHDMNLALERWVETGVAPGAIIASKVASAPGQPNTVMRTRPICPYPQVARHQGSGSPDDAANFACVTPGMAAKVK
jgi:tannase/feruloyl esterase